ncbi:hypothetical protein ABZY36_06185 [Streptomyces sp. NPDC006627]|uniref:hypothetical protein n=1 Tax=Streptomyces sp. NPDC006627 TaxID=3154679 RepID=UPI0033A45EAA
MNSVLPSKPTTSTRPSSRARSSSVIRSRMPARISSFTWARTVDAIASMVEYRGISSPASTSFSSAMLIRSAGLFFDAASIRIVPSASARAAGPS